MGRTQRAAGGWLVEVPNRNNDAKAWLQAPHRLSIRHLAIYIHETVAGTGNEVKAWGRSVPIDPGPSHCKSRTLVLSGPGAVDIDQPSVVSRRG